MPELPEVETVRTSLSPGVIGRRILEAHMASDRLCRPRSAKEITRELTNRSIQQVERHGKLLIFVLDQGFWTVHLGMTGQLTLFDPQQKSLPFYRQPNTGLERTNQHPVDKHTHGVIQLDDGNRIHYRDVRKFGKWGCYPTRQAIPELTHWGPDGLELATYQHTLFERLKKSQQQIKACLLNQNIVAGIGNIYADEALFLAGIHPRRKASNLSRKRLEKLFESITSVLRKGIQNQGTSLKDYVNSKGEKGLNQESLQVYGRGEKPCLHCGATLKKTQVAQRTTVYCSNCQS